MDRLGLTEDELCRALGVDPLAVISGDLDDKPQLPILLALTGEAAERVGEDVLRRWLRAGGPNGRPLDHLLANAVTYSASDRPVVVTAGADRRVVRISVSDYGVGMTGEETARCFEQFWQARAPDSPRAHPARLSHATGIQGLPHPYPPRCKPRGGEFFREVTGELRRVGYPHEGHRGGLTMARVPFPGLIASANAPAPSAPRTNRRGFLAAAGGLAATAASMKVAAAQTVAPLGQEPQPAFAQVREIRNRLSGSYPRVHFGVLSMGMSDDFQAAIAEGSTQVRIGTAIFGPRRTDTT